VTDRVRFSKFLSLVLRHRPELIGLELDEEGWADVAAVLAGARRKGLALDADGLAEVVATCEKQRYAFSEDGLRIRANQGHSVNIDLALEAVKPPASLFHGTVGRFVPSIRQHGLQKRGRRHVHLSRDEEIAAAVGRRRGAAVILVIDAARMHAAGHTFYCAMNGVWLVDSVPPEFISGLPE